MSKETKEITEFKECQFNGVVWDAKAIGAIQTVADGLLENAKGMHALVSVFTSQNIHIDALVKISTIK